MEGKYLVIYAEQLMILIET